MSQDYRMHAFVPAALVDKISRMIVEGKVYVIKNFQVKDYTDADKYRPVQMEKQIVFTADTKVKEVDEKDVFIPHNNFDLFEYGDLKQMTKQVLYLTGYISNYYFHISSSYNLTFTECTTLLDVIGILQKRPAINRVPNKQVNIKFKLSDGR